MIIIIVLPLFPTVRQRCALQQRPRVRKGPRRIYARLAIPMVVRLNYHVRRVLIYAVRDKRRPRCETGPADTYEPPAVHAIISLEQQHFRGGKWYFFLFFFFLQYSLVVFNILYQWFLVFIATPCYKT